MSESQVHFELFARRDAAAGWRLELAVEDRAQAIEAAELMLAEKRAVAVRVTRETLDPGTREYRSHVLMTKGELATVKPTVRREESSPLCVSPADLYSGHARERIGRLLEQWLRRRQVTPFELLHRPDLAEALDASGMELQHAIQKIAIPEAQERGVSTHEVMRHYQKLADMTLQRVMGDGRRGAFPDVSGAGFAEAAVRLAGQPDSGYLLGGGVARHLASAAVLSGKLDLILDLADAAPAAERAPQARALAFMVLAQPFSEVLGARGGLGDLAGPEQDLGGSLAVLTRLVASAEIASLIRLEPGLERQFLPLTPRIARLARWLEDPAFKDVRTALARRILSELNGPRRLRPGDPQGEILMLRALAMALTASAGRLLPAEEVHSAFTERSRALVGADFVQAYIGGGEGALHEVQALVRLAENVVGGANKRAAARWMATAIGGLRFEKDMRAGSESPSARLAMLAELQQSLGRTGLDAADRLRLADKIGEIGGLVEADSRLTAGLARSAAPGAQRLLTLLKLACGETAPLGPVAHRAKGEIQKLVRAPELRASLAAAPELLDRIKQVMLAA